MSEHGRQRVDGAGREWERTRTDLKTMGSVGQFSLRVRFRGFVEQLWLVNLTGWLETVGSPFFPNSVICFEVCGSHWFY